MHSYLPSLSVQWHITTDCSNRCKHCYMFDESTYKAEQEHSLSFPDLLKILDRLDEFSRKWGCQFPHFALSGGDPLLRKEWPELIQELTNRGKSISIMGNPETLNDRVVRQLKDFNVKVFQMSLDGLASVHDELRSPGSFERTIKALQLLKEHGIGTNIMFTLFEENQDQLLPLMRYLAHEGQPDSFSFDLGCAAGEGAALSKGFTPSDMKEIFTAYMQEKKRLTEAGCSVSWREKPTLMRLLHHEEGGFAALSSTAFPVIEGCLIGWSCIAILSDGTVMACRRLPLAVGKLPEQSFEDIFLGSELIRKFRRRESYKLCQSCDFYQHCRGCPAYSYGISKDAFDASPVCFRDSQAKTANSWSVVQSPDLDCSNDEEYAYFRAKFFYDPQYVTKKLKDDPQLQYMLLRLNGNPEEISQFLTAPIEYLARHNMALDDYALAILKFLCTSPTDLTGNQHSSALTDLSALVAPYLLRSLFRG